MPDVDGQKWRRYWSVVVATLPGMRRNAPKRNVILGLVYAALSSVLVALSTAV
jgi:hypothetical protein